MNCVFVHNDGGRTAAGYKGEPGDCVCRALSIALELPYESVYQDLIAMVRGMRQTKKIRGSHPRTGVARSVYHNYLLLKGWTWVPTMAIGTGCKVHLRSDELPQGRLVVRLSKHVAAVLDGKLHDTYDSSRDGTRCVYGYYQRGARAAETSSGAPACDSLGEGEHANG